MREGLGKKGLAPPPPQVTLTGLWVFREGPELEQGSAHHSLLIVPLSSG